MFKKKIKIKIFNYFSGSLENKLAFNNFKN